MKTELEKCLAGEWYDCHVPVFPELKRKTHCLLMKYNFLPYEGKEEKQVLLCGMFGNNVSVGTPFLCDYGCNIHIGDRVVVNTGCTFVGFNRIALGKRGLIASDVRIYTARYPVGLDERLTPVGIPEGSEYIRHTFALPVTIEDGGWIGGGAIILPGVTIGEGGVIGAGSVVAENIQANSLVPAG